MSIQNTFYLDVDIKRDNYVEEPQVTQNDDIAFVLRLTDDGSDMPIEDVSTYTLASSRPDGQSVVTVGVLTGPSEVTFELGSTEVSVPGRVKAAIQLYDVDGRVSSIPFTYEVKKDLAVDYIPSADEQTLIQLVLGEGPAILNAAELVTAEANKFIANNVRVGEYDNGATYGKGNEVGYDGSSYVALQDTQGNLPSDAAYWALRARKGQGDVNSVNGVLPDGTGNVELIIPDPDLSGLATKTELQTKVGKGDLVVNVKDYGAVGDGSADDTAAINAAINSANSNSIIYFPLGTYLLNGNGTELIKVNKSVDLVGESPRTTLAISSSVPNTTDVIRYDIPSKVRFLTIKNLTIAPVSGTPARHGIHFDVTDSNQQIANSLVERIYVEQLGSSCIKVSNPTNNDGFFANHIEKCFLVGGVTLERCGDSVVLRDNIITGNGIGIDMTAVPGAAQVVIETNNITSKAEKIRIGAGALQVKITRNQLEQVFDYEGASGALVLIEGNAQGSIISCDIIGNNINGAIPTIKPANLIKLDYAEATVIKDNYLQKPQGTSIYISASSKDTKIGSNRWGTAEIEPSVTDFGIGTRNVWQVPTIASGWQNNGTPTDDVGFMKDSDGYVHLKGLIITTLNPPTLPVIMFSIPPGFRPKKSGYHIAYGTSGGVNHPIFINITATGSVVVQDGVSALYDIISFEDIKYFAEVL